MNFQEYVQTVRLRARPMEHDKQVKHALIGMITELGELGDAFKRNFVYGKELDNVNIMEEVGDFLWYFVLFLDEHRLHMGMVDDFVAGQQPKDYTLTDEQDIDIIFALSMLIGSLAGAEQPDLTKEIASDPNMRAGLFACVGLCRALLTRHGGYTLANCLDRNDAKLEQRTGKKFNATAILNRDTAAERTILESVNKAVDDAKV